MQNINCSLSISIMSGKGGVGKTNMAVNLGYSLFGQGYSVLLMDCDLGLANLDVLLGQSPQKNLQDLLLPDVDVREVIAEVEPGGFDFLPATSGVPELVDLDEDIQALLLEKLVELAGSYDFFIMDLGAGISRTVLSFAAMTHLKVVVVTPEPTSLTDSYAMMKVLKSNHGVQDFHVLVNQAADTDESRLTHQRLHAACEKFLGLDIRHIGGVRHDSHVVEAVRKQVPFTKLFPDSPAAQDLRNFAKAVADFRTGNMRRLSEEGVLLGLEGSPKDSNT